MRFISLNHRQISVRCLTRYLDIFIDYYALIDKYERIHRVVYIYEKAKRITES